MHVYDSENLVEAAMRAFLKFQGRAYETRHQWDGNLLTGDVVFDKDSGSDDGWFARMGSSEYFSNWTGRQGRPNSRDGSSLEANVYARLYDTLGMAPARRAEFSAYVDQLIIAEFQYVVARLHASGIYADLTPHCQIDLMWLLPKKSGDFPVPVIVEAKFLDFKMEHAWIKSFS